MTTTHRITASSALGTAMAAALGLAAFCLSRALGRRLVAGRGHEVAQGAAADADRLAQYLLHGER